MDSFKSAAYFPKFDKNKSKLALCIDKNLPIFSMDLDKSGAKTFFCCGFEYFVNHLYKKNNYRNCYEVLQFNKPSKIYLDFDCLSEDCTRKKFDGDFQDFMNILVFQIHVL